MKYSCTVQVEACDELIPRPEDLKKYPQAITRNQDKDKLCLALLRRTTEENTNTQTICLWNIK
jgi:hypothetical protein